MEYNEIFQHIEKSICLTVPFFCNFDRLIMLRYDLDNN